MPCVARVGDRVEPITCCCHSEPDCITTGGVISSGSPTTQADGKPVARVGDSVQLDCGHTSLIASGSGIMLTDGIPTARVGDLVEGECGTGGKIASGSPTTFAD